LDQIESSLPTDFTMKDSRRSSGLCLYHLLFFLLLSMYPAVHHHGRHFNDAVLHKSVVRAKELIAANKPNEVKKLVIMFVFTEGLLEGDKARYLKCSLLKLRDNFLPSTPADIFLWLPVNASHVTPRWLTEMKDVYLMEIQREAWFVSSLANDTSWVGRDAFNLDYYLTGRWRLTFSLDFAHQMGYKYHLQLDDDTIINNKVGYNFVEKMRMSDVSMVRA
jgi:hypothetical protein